MAFAIDIMHGYDPRDEMHPQVQGKAILAINKVANSVLCAVHN